MLNALPASETVVGLWFQGTDVAARHSAAVVQIMYSCLACMAVSPVHCVGL